MEVNVAQGKIKWFNADKGYGFIERPAQEDLFVHISQWRGAPSTVPQQGDAVTFREGEGPQGQPEAKEVRPAV